jgi:hypothetical protein
LVRRAAVRDRIVRCPGRARAGSGCWLGDYTARRYCRDDGKASDLVDRLDRRRTRRSRFHICNFLEESPVRSAWSIVCNPHFDYIREFCERGLEIATYKVAMIMPRCAAPAARWLGLLPLETIYLLTEAVDATWEWIAAGNVPGGGRDDFCWLVFNSKRTRFTRACAGWLVACASLRETPRAPARRRARGKHRYAAKGEASHDQYEKVCGVVLHPARMLRRARSSDDPRSHRRRLPGGQCCGSIVANASP